MRRGLLAFSIVGLIVIGAASVAQTLLFIWGVVYDARGLPTDSTPATLAATWIAAVGVPLGFALSAGAFAYGVVAMSAGRAWRWLAALLVVGGLALAGLLAVIWTLLSANSPVSLATPLLLVPLVTVTYSLRPAVRAASVPA